MWQVIKGYKEERSKAFEAAKALREGAAKENRDLSADESAKHDAYLAEVESYGKRIEREERSAALGEFIGSRGNPAEDVANNVNMPAKDLSNYSLLRAMRGAMTGKLDGLEGEVSREIEMRTGKKAQGFFMPMSMSSNRALDTTAGTGAVGVNLLPDLITLLRNKLILQSVGATIMTDMQGKFSLPRQSGAATAYWVGESGAPTASAQTINQVAFVPKTVGAFTDISRQYMNQSSIDAEAFVRNDLAAVLARAIDAAGIAGTGSSNQPTGIVNASGISTISHGTNGGAETWAQIVAYEKAVLAANVDPSSKLAYLTNAKVAAALKTTDKTTGGYGQFVLGNDKVVNGYDLAVSNAVSSAGTKGTGTALSTMIFGNFADLVMAFWGGLDITVDPYSGSTSGTVRVVALQDVDIELRHPESFAVATDIIA